MITIKEIFDFQRQYCAYYHVLEADFVETEKYLTVNPDNYTAYSNEFINQIQAICGEVDVTLKYLCKLINPKFNGRTLPHYKECIMGSNPFFARASVGFVRVQDMMLTPWSAWGKVTEEDDAVLSPEWWKMYNKIKHDRTAIHPETKKPYYKYANQGNTLNALAALYIVISYTLFILCQFVPEEDANYFINEWRNSSKLFNAFVVRGVDQVIATMAP